MFPKKNNKILNLPTTLLAVVAHEDDEVLGPGGLLIKNVELGGKSHVICFGGSTRKRAKEFINSCKSMGVTYELLKKKEGYYAKDKLKTQKYLKEVIMKLKPEFVITHRKDWDYHIDHKDVSELTRNATIMAQTPLNGHMAKGLLYHETHFMQPEIHIFVDITKVYPKIIESAKCHISQMMKNKNYYLYSLSARSKLRGVQAGCERAEAYFYEPLQLIASMNRRNMGI